MKLRRKLWLVAALCGAVFFGFRSCEPVKASAVDTVTLTPNQTRALFGDEIQFRYFDGSDYQYGTFTYQNINTIPTNVFEMGRGSRDKWDALTGQTSRYVLYRTTTSIPSQADPYLTVSIVPSVNLSGVTDVQFMAGLSTPCVYTDGELTDTVTQRTNNTVWYGSYKVNGDGAFSTYSFSYSASPTVQLDYWAWQEFQSGNWKQPFLLTAFDIHRDVFSLVTDITLSRSGPVTRNPNDTGNTYLLIQCPTLSSTYSNDSNYEPGTDLTATNIKLDNIVFVLNAIYNASVSMSDKLDTINETLQDIAANQEQDDDEPLPDSGSPVFSVPVLLDNKLLEIDPELNFYFADSPILGGTASGISSDGVTPGGQIFLPDGQNTPMIAADPSNGGVTSATTGIFGMFNDILKTNPIMSKLIVLFLAGFIARWAIFRGRGG